MPQSENGPFPEAAPASDDPAAPGPGAVLADRYVMGALLGTGGMGRVHAAHDRKLQRDVAVKLLGSTRPEPEALRRFSREALATGALQHPNVVALFDVGEEQGRPFLVTELLKGTTLRARLQQGPLPQDEAVRIARQVAAALAAAHDKGFTHRDLKPENIFLTDEGWVKILDFGLVKMAEALAPTRDGPGEPDHSSTAAGRMLGTVGYMAPEQVRGRPVDPRADVFNFGVVLYEMLSGKRAFRGASPTETGYAILFKEPEALPASVPRALRALVEGCLEKDRERRLASAREILQALDGPGRAPKRRWPRPSRRLLAAAGGVVAVAVLAVLAARWRRPIQPRPGLAPPNGTVAILPFSAGDAPDFAWLSDGIVDLLGRDFEGGGDLRAVDAASVLRAIGGESTADVDKVRGATAQVGANYFVLGRIEQRRGELVLEAVLHSGDAGEPITQAVAQGRPMDILALVRKLSDQLQSRPLQPKDFGARLAKLAERTTRSLPALQAWLDGERLQRRGHWDESVAALQRAVAADPEFALAHYRLGIASTLTNPGLAEDALQRALRYSDRLTRTERVLVQGWLDVQKGNLAEAERTLIEATRQAPGNPETWMQLGELYFHQNPLRARSPQESTDAFQRVLVLDPLNTEAMSHLVDLAQVRGERAVVSRLSDRLVALTDDPIWGVVYRMARAWARGDAAEHDAALAGLRAPGLARSMLNSAFVRAEWQMDGFADAAAIADAVVDTGANAQRGYSLYLHAVVDLLRGRPEAARAELAQSAEINPGGDAAFLGPWLDTLDFVAVSPAQLAASRAAAARLDADRLPYLGPAKQYLIGALALRAGDAAAAERSASELDGMPSMGASSITTDLALALRARALAARGDAAGALALLERQQLRIPMRQSIFYARVAEPRLRASLLEALGRAREALPIYEAIPFYSVLDPVFAPPGHLGKARALDALGDRDGAISEYSLFTMLWKDCEPAEQPELDRARARLAQLRETTGPRAAR